MAQTPVDQPNRVSDYLVYEDEQQYSRDEVVVASGQNLKGGTVIARLTADSTIVAYDNAGVDGSEVAVGVLIGPVNATAAATRGVILARHGIVKREGLMYDVSVDAAGKTAAEADLKALGILVRQAL